MSVRLFWVFNSERTDTTIRVRISLHQGQVIAVHLLQGLDLFGTAVNKAAKLQACAGSGEVACSNEFFEAIRAYNPRKITDRFSKRKSNFMYKEMPLEAQVINCHELAAELKIS